MTRHLCICFVLFFRLLFLAVCQVGCQLPNQGSNLHTLQWKHRVLTTGLPGKTFVCLLLLLKQITTDTMVQNNTTIIPYSSTCQKSDMSLTGITQSFQQGCTPFFAWNVSLGSVIFLRRSQVVPMLLFSSISSP